ncbi:MAG: phospholipase D-like domain-containing protein, partial [Burkholderiaceae bacterium]|nr:phospholipase D-like domain-containing protein [Burkholderiaceae bacterium]
MLRRCMLLIRLCLLALLLCGGVWRPAIASMAFIDNQIAAHPNETGVVVLDTGEAALRARAWLADHAQRSIEVQYFIWSSDNIGILATEALLRAAERGVKVRVIVDDILIDAPDKTLLALARHPNVDIRIYNPRHQVGTPFYKRALNVLTDFRGVNQRMHDKTFIVDGKVAITGGRNMADEYFDYDSEYTFRDRDALLVGDAAQAMRANFDAFWASKLAVPVESLYDGWGLMQKNVKVDAAEVQKIYRELHA